MLKFFPHIPFESRINRISGLTRILLRPVRDYLWVELKRFLKAHRAVRYGICKNPDMGINHMAYLRHAVLCLQPVFYQYVVPTEQPFSAKSQYPHKSVIQIINDIIKAHGGQLVIESNKNGSIFEYKCIKIKE